MIDNRVIVLPCDECEFADSDGKCFTQDCMYAADLQRESFDKSVINSRKVPPPLPPVPDLTYLYEDFGIIRGIKRLINKMKGRK